MSWRHDIGLGEALQETLGLLSPLPPVEVPLAEAAFLVAARDVIAAVDCPSLKDRKPQFCLAGGPASNEMGFLQIALPGLLRLAGHTPRPFPRRRARMSSAVGGS